MNKNVYNLKLELSWSLIKIISQIDRFDASWSSVEKIEGQSLKQLKSIATIQSIGASTRIEGSKMTDKEVEILLNNIDISKIENRDAQEVMGYSNVHDLITHSYNEIEISKNDIQNLHNQLLKFSEKDQWHRGKYKQLENAVEANFPDGTRQIIFKTTPPGLQTQAAMDELINWYHNEKEVHPLIITATFVYEFLSIHPFQDGNGRLSRLLTTLLLMKNGYLWIQYISFEHEIENNKKNYYRNLRNCQAQRPNENISDWIEFFFQALINVQRKLQRKLDKTGVITTLTPKEKQVYSFITMHYGAKSGEISKKIGIPISTIKRILRTLTEKELIQKFGKGAGTSYGIK